MMTQEGDETKAASEDSSVTYSSKEPTETDVNDGEITHVVSDTNMGISKKAVSEDGAPLDSDNTDDKSPSHPVDRGWAWVVLAASVYEVFVFGGMLRSYGIFFLQYQSRFQSSASAIAMMSTIQNLVQSFTGLLVMTLWLPRVSTRVTVIIGGTFIIAGYLITAFAKQLVVFYLAQGILGGIGLAMVHPPIYAILGVYFKKHLGLAISIFTSGASVGGLVWAPVLTTMLQEYGYSGAMLIVSGLLGNIIVAALLMRSPEAYSRKKKQQQCHPVRNGNNSDEGSLLLSNTDCNDVESCKINQRTDHNEQTEDVTTDRFKPDKAGSRHALLQRPYSLDEGRSNMDGQTSPLLRRVIASSIGNMHVRHRTKADSYDNKADSLRNLDTVLDAICRSEVSVYSESDTMETIKEDIHGATNTDARDDNEEVKTETIWWARMLTLLKSNALVVFRALFDVKLLTHPVFIIILVMAFCMVSGLPLSPLFIPPFAKDINIDDQSIALLISIQSIIDLVSRISFAVVADKKLIKRTHVLVIAAVLLGTTWHLMGLVKTFTTLFVCVVVAGVCAGLYASTYSVIIVEYLGLAKFKSSLGFCTLCHGISIAVFFPIAGRLRDSTGTYIATYHVFGGLAYVGACLAMLIPFVNRWNQKRIAQTDPESVKP